MIKESKEIVQRTVTEDVEAVRYETRDGWRFDGKAMAEKHDGFLDLLRFESQCFMVGDVDVYGRIWLDTVVNEKAVLFLNAPKMYEYKVYKRFFNGLLGVVLEEGWYYLGLWNAGVVCQMGLLASLLMRLLFSRRNWIS